MKRKLISLALIASFSVLVISGCAGGGEEITILNSKIHTDTDVSLYDYNRFEYDKSGRLTNRIAQNSSYQLNIVSDTFDDYGYPLTQKYEQEFSSGDPVSMDVNIEYEYDSDGYALSQVANYTNEDDSTGFDVTTTYEYYDDHSIKTKTTKREAASENDDSAYEVVVNYDENGHETSYKYTSSESTKENVYKWDFDDKKNPKSLEITSTLKTKEDTKSNTISASIEVGEDGRIIRAYDIKDNGTDVVEEYIYKYLTVSSPSNYAKSNSKIIDNILNAD